MVLHFHTGGAFHVSAVRRAGLEVGNAVRVTDRLLHVGSASEFMFRFKCKPEVSPMYHVTASLTAGLQHEVQCRQPAPAGIIIRQV